MTEIWSTLVQHYDAFTHRDTIWEEEPFYLRCVYACVCVFMLLCVYSHLYSEWGLSTTMCGLGEAVALFATYAFMDFSWEGKNQWTYIIIQKVIWDI